MRLALRRLLEHEQGYKGNLTLFEIFGLQYYFPENFRCYLKFSKARIFLIPLSIAFSTPKIRFPFLHRRRPKGDQRAGLKEKVRRAFSPGPTDRPWVSEDTFSTKNGLLNLGNEIAKNKTVENRREFI